MGKLIVNLILVAASGCALIWSYNNLINSIKSNYKNEANYYIAQNQSIDAFLSTHKKPLTKDALIAYDQKHNTNIASAIDRTSVMQMSYRNSITSFVVSEAKQNIEDANRNALTIAKYENNLKVSELQEKEQGFWSYLPPIPALIFGSIGIFFATLITNLGNCCAEKIPQLIKISWLRKKP